MDASAPEANSIIKHVTVQPGVCHNCGVQLSTAGMTVCDACDAINYDW